MTRRDDREPSDVEGWHLEYMRRLDEGRGVSPAEFVAGIPDATLRESVLRRLLLFGRIYRTVRDEAQIPRGTLPEIPGYEIEREVGRGGSGSVYRAKEIASGRPVAIKLVPLPGVDPQLIRRFAREYRIVGELRHRGIVRIHAMGDLPAAIFFVLEWIEGCTLAAILDGLRGFDPEKIARLPARVVLDRVRFGARDGESKSGSAAEHGRDEASSVSQPTLMDWIIGSFTTLADGLAEIHARGIVHRDISPSNVMIRASDASPVLLDFGLARQEGSPAITATGDLFGKPHYVPPECARRLRIGSSPAADIYSLGAVLYETLALRRPFDGHDTGEILRRVLKEDPPLLRARNRDVSSELQALVLWMLEKNPRRRAPSARVVADDLARIARGERSLAAATRPLRTARRAAKRLRPVLLSGVIVAVAATLFHLGGIPSARRGKSSPVAPGVAPVPPFRVADVRVDANGIRVSSLTHPIELTVPARAMSTGGERDASELAVVVVELDGDDSDEMVFVEEGDAPSRWDLVAIDLDSANGAGRLWSLRVENPDLMERLGADGYRPGRIDCADVDADGATDVLLLLHGADPARSLVLTLDHGGRLAGQLSLPTRVGESARSFFVADWPSSPNPWLVIAGRYATDEAEPFVLVLDPSSFAGPPVEARRDHLPARGTEWIVSSSVFGDVPRDAGPEASLLRVEDRCVIRLSMGEASVSFDASAPIARFERDRTAEESISPSGLVTVVHGTDGPARPLAPTNPAVRLLAGHSLPSPRTLGAIGSWRVATHAFGITLRDESGHAAVAIRFASRFAPAARIRAVTQSVPVGVADERDLFVTGVSFASHPSSNLVVGMRPNGSVLGPVSLSARAPFEAARLPNDAGLDPREIVGLGTARFTDLGDPTHWVLLSSRTRGSVVILDEKLEPVSTVWAPGPALDARVWESRGGARLAALFRFATSGEPVPSDEVVYAAISLRETPRETVLLLGHGAVETAARDHGFPVAIFKARFGASSSDPSRLDARGDRLAIRITDDTWVEFDEDLKTWPPSGTPGLQLVLPSELRPTIVDPPLVEWRIPR